MPTVSTGTIPFYHSYPMKRKHIPSVAAIILTISYTQAAPVINEISPFNAGLHPDIEGEHPDWIEIHNPDTSAVNLSGWFLTDEATALNQWAFPTGTSIPAGGYIIVFASGKTEITNELHTNFSLSGSGEYLALVQPDGTISADYSSELDSEERFFFRIRVESLR